MNTITLAYEVTEKQAAAVVAMLNSEALENCGWNGAKFEVVRDDFTCIDEESTEAVALLRKIYDTIEEN